MRLNPLSALLLTLVSAVLVNAAPSQADAPDTSVRYYPIADLLRAAGSSRADAAAGLSAMLKDFVLPDSWHDNGANVGQVRVSGNVLVITQAAEGHAEIEGLLAALRGVLVQTDRQQDYGPRSTYSILHRRVGELQMDQQPLFDALDQIARTAQCDVRIADRSLAPIGVTSRTPVTLHLWNASVSQALDAICASDRRVDYEVKDGFVNIGPAGGMRSTLAAYDIRPLMDALLPAKGPHALRKEDGGTLGWTRRDAVDVITKLIEDTIAPESWKDNGGNNPLGEFGGALIVMQTYRGHRELSGLLDALTSALVAPTQPATAPAASSKPGKLDEMIDELRLEGQTLDQAIDMLAAKTHADMVLDRQSVEQAGALDKPIDLQVRNVPLHTALSIVLEVAGTRTPLGYAVRDDGVIVVASADHLPGVAVVRIYNIRDLIDQTINSGKLQAPGSRARLASDRTTRQDVVDALTKLIEDTVDTDSWKDNGGSVGALRELSGLLIVSATADTQKKVDALLTKMRNQDFRTIIPDGR